MFSPQACFIESALEGQQEREKERRRRDRRTNLHVSNRSSPFHPSILLVDDPRSLDDHGGRSVLGSLSRLDDEGLSTCWKQTESTRRVSRAGEIAKWLCLERLTDVVGRTRKNESGGDSSCDGEVVGLIVSVESVDASKEREDGVLVGVCEEKKKGGGGGSNFRSYVRSREIETSTRLTAISCTVQARR